MFSFRAFYLPLSSLLNCITGYRLSSYPVLLNVQVHSNLHIDISAYPDMILRMEILAENLKGLSDPTRLRIIRLLEHGELCVCDLMAGLDLPQSTVSRHTSLLKKGGWVSGKRKGKWVYYKLSIPANVIQSGILEILNKELPAIKDAELDYERLLKYLETKKPVAVVELWKAGDYV